MTIVGWLILGFVALLLLGRTQRASSSHPCNKYKPIATPGTTSGDKTDTGTTIGAGVPETSPHCNVVITAPPPHIVFPILPPPIAIQRPADGTLVRGSGPEVDLMQGGKRRWVPDPYTFTAMGFDWNNVQVLPDDQFNAIPTGVQLKQLFAPKPVAPPVVISKPIVVAPKPPISRQVCSTRRQTFYSNHIPQEFTLGGGYGVQCSSFTCTGHNCCQNSSQYCAYSGGKYNPSTRHLL